MLEKKCELAQLKENTAYSCLEKLTVEVEKIQKEKEVLENLVRKKSTFLLMIIVI